MKKTMSFIVGFLTVLGAGIALAQDGIGSVVIEEPPATTLTAMQKPEATETTITTEGTVTEGPKETSTEEKEEVGEEAGKETDTTAPAISVIEPIDGAVFTEKTIIFRGETEPGARVLAGEYEAEVDPEGHWAITLVLFKGSNTAAFKAIDAAGNVGKASVTVVYRPEPTEEKEVEFTANQKYFQNAEGYEKFYGTATPGSTIQAVSDFGYRETTVGENGEWYLKVHFDALVGVTFPIVVSDGLGHEKVFEFTVLEPKPKEFWAAQKYGSSSQNPPYDLFYGEGTPGMKVSVTSLYGAGSTVVGEGGGWELKIFFETAPPNQSFEVVVETSGGHRQVFTFTRLEG